VGLPEYLGTARRAAVADIDHSAPRAHNSSVMVQTEIEQPLDAIVVLGSQPDPRNWMFPSHVFRSLDRAIALHAESRAPIAVSGRYAIRFDSLGIRPPFFECDGMADYLLQCGVRESSIIREAESKDTISNLYYLKHQLFEPRRTYNLTFPVAGFRAPRLAFLCKRILGSQYRVRIEPVSYESHEIYPNEADTLHRQRDFLRPMRSGDDAWLDGRFFDDPFYAAMAERTRRRPRQ
jgi:hypothetical protein